MVSYLLTNHDSFRSTLPYMVIWFCCASAYKRAFILPLFIPVSVLRLALVLLVLAHWALYTGVLPVSVDCWYPHLVNTLKITPSTSASSLVSAVSTQGARQPSPYIYAQSGNWTPPSNLSTSPQRETLTTGPRRHTGKKKLFLLYFIQRFFLR